jgi:hypothetical protein
MADIVTKVGYICPRCRRQVSVINSFTPPAQNTSCFFSECECGYRRAVLICEVWDLDVWREEQTA